MILNEYEKISGFYKLWNVEKEIRQMATKYRNSFHMGLFAYSRDAFEYSFYKQGHRTKKEARHQYLRERLAQGLIRKIQATKWKMVGEAHFG